MTIKLIANREADKENNVKINDQGISSILMPRVGGNLSDLTI